MILFIIIISLFFLLPNPTLSLRINPVSNDKVFIIKKNYLSINGLLSIEGNLDQEAEIEWQLFAKGKPQPAKYIIKIDGGGVNKSQRFDIYDEEQIKITFRHGRAKKGYLDLKLVINQDNIHLFMHPSKLFRDGPNASLKLL